MATRVTDGARRERHEKRETLFSSRAAALCSRFSQLPRSRARALEKERLLAVSYLLFFIKGNSSTERDHHTYKYCKPQVQGASTLEGPLEEPISESAQLP